MFFELSFNLFLRIDFIGEIISFEALNKIKFIIKIDNIINVILLLNNMVILVSDCGLIKKFVVDKIIRIIIMFVEKFILDGLFEIEWVAIIIRIRRPPTYIKNSIIPIQAEFVALEINRDRIDVINTSMITIRKLLFQKAKWMEVIIRNKISIIFFIVNFNL